MTLSKWTTVTLLGVMSLSSGALATRSLAQSSICQRKPDLEFCKGIPAPPPAEPKATDGGVAVSAAGPAEAVVQGAAPAKPTPPPPNGSSSARCFAYARAGGSAGGQTTATAAAEVAAYVCGGEGSATAEAAAEATATLFAQAVAQASVFCEASGDTAFYAGANAKAVQTAEAWLSAYAEAVASAAVCDKCDAYVSSFAYVEKYVFLEAVASASAILDGYTSAQNLPQFIGAVNSYESTVETAVATAFAAAVAGAETYYDGSACFAWVNTAGCIFTPDDPEVCAECVAVAVSESFITEIDAIATASAAAATYTCGENVVVEAEAQVVAKSLAEATAIAVSEIFISCKADEGAYACADASTFITDAAYAVAKAFAEAWAVAYDCTDTCNVEATAVTQSMGSVLATASTSAYASLCAADGESYTVADLQVDIESKYLEAIADAYAGAFISNPPLVCVAAASAGTSVTPVPPK